MSSGRIRTWGSRAAFDWRRADRGNLRVTRRALEQHVGRFARDSRDTGDDDPGQEPIANAIKTLTDHIRHHSHNTAWDIRHVPTPIEIKAPKDAIEATCKKLDALGSTPRCAIP